MMNEHIKTTSKTNKPIKTIAKTNNERAIKKILTAMVKEAVKITTKDDFWHFPPSE